MVECHPRRTTTRACAFHDGSIRRQLADHTVRSPAIDVPFTINDNAFRTFESSRRGFHLIKAELLVGHGMPPV